MLLLIVKVRGALRSDGGGYGGRQPMACSANRWWLIPCHAV